MWSGNNLVILSAFLYIREYAYSCVVVVVCDVCLFVMQRWREFCNLFEGQVEDWNMATLLRIDATGDVSEQNTVIGRCCMWSCCSTEYVLNSLCNFSCFVSFIFDMKHLVVMARYSHKGHDTIRYGTIRYDPKVLHCM